MPWTFHPRAIAACLLMAASTAVGLLAIAGEPDNAGPPVEADTVNAYRQPVPNLDATARERFNEGLRNFDQRWVVAPSAFGLWGRGPTSNGEACTDCHANGGRGRPSDSENIEIPSMLVRLSIPSSSDVPATDPRYGDQLQEQGILGRVPAEGRALVRWIETQIAMSDGAIVRLRRPSLELRQMAFGPLRPGTMTSIRVAPPLVGAGLIDAVSESTILAMEQLQSQLSLRGRANRVWDVAGNREAIGRFGYKANQPDLLQQTLTAYHADLGVTSYWFSAENCPPVQERCAIEPPGGHPELPDPFLQPVLLYLRALSPPERRALHDPAVVRGEQAFVAAGCAACHVPELRTGEYASLPQLSNVRFAPYTDLLIHDLGDALADGRPDFEAGPRDWRTAPLWGVGLSKGVNGNAELLHDGRARDVPEAILWHGGEAATARDAFRNMPKSGRDALIAFIESL